MNPKMPNIDSPRRRLLKDEVSRRRIVELYSKGWTVPQLIINYRSSKRVINEILGIKHANDEYKQKSLGLENPFA